MTITRGSIADLCGQQFEKIFFDGVTKVDPVFDKLFAVKQGKHQTEYLSSVAGLPVHMQKTEGDAPASGEIAQKYDESFTHVTYSLITRVTKEAYDDDLSGTLKKIPMLQGVSARQTIEIFGAQLFDRSQTAAYTGPDGKVLCATDHPRSDGGTWSNRPTANADLSVTSLEAGLSDMRATTDDYGNPMVIFPKYLVIPGANEFTAIQLLKNAEKAGTTNRDINAVRERGLSYIINDYFTDTDSWYLLRDPEENEIIFYMRENPSGRMFAAADGTEDANFVSRFRVSKGWVDARGIYGSIGG